MFLIQLDVTIVNVALPDIGRHLHASVSGLQWTADGYTVPLAALLLAAGRFGDLLGHKRIFIAGLAVFAAASVWCAVAPTAGWLITARAVQGVGAACELPATLAILSHTFTTPAARARAIGIWSAVAGLSLVAGPLLGGWLVDAAGWQSVFLLNAPVAVATGVLAVAVVRERPPAAARGGWRALDLPGQVLVTAALVLVTVVTIEGHRHGWTSGGILTLSALALACLLAFVAVELRTAEPILPLRYFADPAFSGANLAGLVQGFTLFGLLFVFSFYFQNVRGDSASAAGARFVPLSVVFVILGPPVGRLVARVGGRWLLAVGLALMGCGALLLTRVGAATGYGYVAAVFVVIGVGFAFATTSMVATAMGAVPPERTGMASSVNNTARQTGGVLGIGILGSLLTGAGGHVTAAGAVDGLQTGVLVSGTAALCGAVVVAVALRGVSRPVRRPAAEPAPHPGQ
jgi:DHA2 family methylenomycin A resistance protein-like MFS transporter